MAESPLEEEILQVCKGGTVTELVPLLDKLRGENTKLQDYRPDRDENHLVLSMLEESLTSGNGDTIRYMADTFNPTRYGSQNKWVFDRRIAYSAPRLDVDTFRVLWQFNHDLATRHMGHLGHPLTIPMIGNDLELAGFMLEHGADPVNSLFAHRPISQNDYEVAPSPEMKNLLKSFAKSENRASREIN